MLRSVGIFRAMLAGIVAAFQSKHVHEIAVVSEFGQRRMWVENPSNRGRGNKAAQRLSRKRKNKIRSRRVMLRKRP